MTFKTRHLFLVGLLACYSVLGVVESGAAVPQLLNHQGRIAVAGVNFNGSGQFKFALVDPDRLAITIERLLGGVPDIVPPGASIIDCMGISGQIERIPLDEILWIEAFQNYTRVYLANAEKPSLCRQTMAAWEALLPADLFLRVGRTEIIHSALIRAVRWTSRAETAVSFNNSGWLLQLGRASALRLKTHMKGIDTRSSVP